MKIEQLAIACKNPEKVIGALSTVFGAGQWSEDTVVARGKVHGFPTENQASLNFNYQIGPFEFELLNYEHGNNWHTYVCNEEGNKAENFLSHLGVHIDDPADFEHTYKVLQEQFNIAQEVVTQSHTNEAIKDLRRYRYVIFDSRKILGFDLKIIQRLNLDETPYVKSRAERKTELQEQMIEKIEELQEIKNEWVNT